MEITEKVDSPYCLICHSESLIKTHTGLFDDRHGAPGKFDILQCNNCGFMMTYPRLDPAKISSLYKKYYPDSNTSVDVLRDIQSLEPRYRAFLSGNDLNPAYYIESGKSILDIGCGIGTSLIYYQNAGAQAYGLDPNPAAKVFAERYGLKIHIGTLDEVPFPDVSFDFITAAQVLEHFPDPDSFFDHAADRLSENGRIIISMPNIASFYRFLCGRRWINWHVPYHQNHFSLKSIKNMIKKYDLEIISYRTITPSIWTRMQFRTLLMNVQEGKANRIWQPERLPADEKSNISSKKDGKFLLVIFKRSFWSLFDLAAALFNRCIDYLNHGDALLIFIKKRN